MRYQSWQKIVSFSLIFSLLFSITFRVPFFSFFSSVSADEEKFYSIVSVLVNEDIYDAVRGKLVRYSEDIQGVLENTKVVIIPVPSDAKVIDVASLNEKLYFEGYKGVKGINFESKLIGTVMVGNIPLPIVFDGTNASKTILPYVDFIEKSYIYNHETEIYEKDVDAPSELVPEIWHGVISPNSGDEGNDIELIKAYFDKNHEYYLGTGKFQTEKGIINGNTSKEIPESYEPYVFYYDQFRESKAVNYESYVGYQAYLQNLEDITYKRYSSELAQKVQNQVLGIQNENLRDLIENAIPGFLETSGSGSSGPDLQNTPDIQTRFVTDNATNKFLEVLNSGTLADMRKYVHNTGRYNGLGNQVNVDMVPFLVSILDAVSGQVVKNVNTSLETEINTLVQKGLSRDIFIPVSFNSGSGVTSGDGGSLNTSGTWGGECGASYTNLLFGTNAATITNASQCSPYRGSLTNSGTLVEANRGYNIKLTQEDVNACQNFLVDLEAPNENVTSNEEMVIGFWAGNTPLNLNKDSLLTTQLQLNTHSLNSSLRPVFDVVGSKEISNKSNTPDPRQCFDNNFIQTIGNNLLTTGGKDDKKTECSRYFQAPVNGNSPLRWNCGTPAVKYIETVQQFQDIYATLTTDSPLPCTQTNLQAIKNDGILLSVGSKKTAYSNAESCGGKDEPTCVCGPSTTYVFKEITSYITHTSPTSQEFGAQVQALTSPNLPIDKDRYIDFFAANGNYAKINYPYLFRVSPAVNQELTLENIDAALKKHLDDVSTQINTVIEGGKPSSLSGTAKKIYDDYLNTGNYPAANFNLYNILKSKALQTYTLDGEEKKLSYYDTLVFSIYWNNLKTPSAKYKFIFENYLSDQFGEDAFDVVLPENKKSYELSYLGAPGDAQNMYIKLDPEEKKENPYASIIAQNLTLQSYLSASNIPKPAQTDATFKCGPPDGVPIWQWIPAVICWLQDMLPPKIGISEGTCGPSLLSEEEQEEIQACQGDVNKNGISDCIEGKLEDGSITLESDSERYYYNTPGALKATLKDKNDIVVTLDSVSYVDFALTKVEIPKDALKEFSGSNKEVIYDTSLPALSTPEARKKAEQYVAYTDVRTRVVQGTAVSYFTSKGKDANVFFEAKLTARDTQKNPLISLSTAPYQIQIRGDRLFLNSYSVEGPTQKDIFVSNKDIVVSDMSQLFLIDTNQENVENVAAAVFAKNTLSQKTILSLTNYSKNGNVLGLSYPLTITVEADGKQIYQEKNILASNLNNFKEFPGFTQSGKYSFIVRDDTGFSVTKNLYFKPEKANKIEMKLGTTIVQTGENITTHLLTLFDRFGNVTSGDIYTISGNIDGKGFVFEENQEEILVSNIIEGYKAFRLRSTNKEANNTLTFEAKDSSGNTLATKTTQIRTLDEMNLHITPPTGGIKVGGGKYSFNLEIKDSSGNILSDLNTRAYMVLSPLYGVPTSPYVEIKAGKGVLELQTATVAAQNVKLEFQVEGIKGIQNMNIAILPEKPIKVDLSLSRSKIEASANDNSLLYAVLKDRYGNDVFSDSTTTLDLEIREEYRSIITADTTQKRVQAGKAEFKLSGTEIPGIAYFKVAASPSLSNNSFNLIGQAPFPKDDLDIALMKDENGLTQRGKMFFTEYNSATYISRYSAKANLLQSQDYLDLPAAIRTELSDFWDTTNYLVVSGVSENAGSIETFYFWGKDDIEGNRYNGIYSVLLGAPYGDITQENYLASALLFDRNNRSLAVTSLLNDPYRFEDVVSFSQKGNIRNISGSADITQDIEMKVDTDAQNRLSLNITNAALGNYIGTAYYTFDTPVLSTCSGNFIDCFDDSETSIVVKAVDSNYTVKKQGGNLVFENNLSQEVFRIDKNGKFIRNSQLYLEVDRNNNGDFLKLFLMNGEKIAAEIAVSYKEGDINITRDQNILNQKLDVLKNTLVVYLKTNMYGTRDIYSQDGNTQKVIFYHDPFGNTKALDSFHESSENGVENFVNEKGIGFEGENTFLLQFAAGQSVGESTRDYFSFSLINLGDPVLSMKHIRKEFPGTDLKKSFDASVGEVLSNDDTVSAYQTFDYNNDQKTDIVLAKTDGYIELLENKDIAEHYLKKGNLVLAIDGGPARLVKTGDFSGDNYDDIFFVSDSGEPVLFNNRTKDFSRYSLKDTLTLSGTIIQAEVFDMDKDTKDDIITLDDAGQIHIFYGNGPSNAPTFTKLKVGDGYGIKLSEAAQNYGGAVYFDGVEDVAPDGDYTDLINSSEAYQEAIDAALENGNEVEAALFGQYLVERLLFIQLPYAPRKSASTPEEDLVNTLEDSLPETNDPELQQQLSTATGALADFLENYSEYIRHNDSTLGENGYSNYSSASLQNTYFLRSEYADSLGLEISKRFIDTSPELLQTGDNVSVELTFKNTGNKRLSNIAYADTIPRNFKLSENTIEVVSENNKEVPLKAGIGMYNFLLDGFYLAAGEETTIRYTLTTLPLKYGYMQVGLFEEGEVGDDVYGDIILKPSEKNCGEQADIYTSVAVRSYIKGKVTPSCDAEKLKLPEVLQDNMVDQNENGVPDYIDNLVGGNTEDLQEYADTVFQDLYADADGDGIPNDEDDMPNYEQEENDFMETIGEINTAIDQISDQVDTLIDGFSCGFGGGSCIATPLNWAPLAPGGDPTLWGYPVGDGLKVNEGIPIFSALTGINIPTAFGCYQVPSVYPVSPIQYTGVCNGTLGAGGSLGVTSPSNYVRLFATPTLTGGFGIAACFGAPAMAAGYSNPPGVHPIIPGGNCIVAAVPLFGCQGDEGDPRVVGYPWTYPNFGIINANCPDGYSKKSSSKPEELNQDFIEEFFEYQETGEITPSLLEKFKTAFTQVAKGQNTGGLPTGPLINIGGADADMGLTVDFDASALSSGNLEDVVQINNTRVNPFPDFLMDWVTRQIEEVVNKLTNLPKVFVILPDFSGIFDSGWQDFGANFQKSFENQKQEKANEENKYQGQIDSLRGQLAPMDCGGEDTARCIQIETKINLLRQKKNITQPETLSGIRAAYEFLGNVPLVNVETETINISVPWPDPASLDRALIGWKSTAEGWRAEIEKASNSWSMGATCEALEADEKEACEEQNAINEKAHLDAQKFLQTLETNIETLEQYKNFPEQLNKLISIKEVRIEQILCNIEAISSLLGGWLSKNGERFKAWVELFVLIKGILKSWQLLIDVFKDYDEGCHQCKNERHDLQTAIFSLISSVIPKLPIIQFPKWPDIILDLHNVRAGINLYLPDFGINLRPIVIPSLPELKLPETPSVDFKLPELPLLPSFQLPELPELPSLPTVELPDLPPPPKIPKLFGAVEGILNIMKLVTKIMCIMKQSPFVPEWRAGDQIAFITERNGYMPMDFIDISLPQFSYPFLDAIKVTTYVNLEFEMEFIVEAVRQVVEPLNTFTSDISNMMKIQVPDLDFSDMTPQDIELELKQDGSIQNNLSDEEAYNRANQGFIALAKLFAYEIQKGVKYMEDNVDESYENKEFVSFVQKQLASPSIAGDRRLDELRNLWEGIGNMTYSKEESLTQKLIENKNKKFETLTEILSTELQKTQKLQEDLKDLGEPSYFTAIAADSKEKTTDVYQERMRTHNLEFVKSALALIEKPAENETTNIQEMGINILGEVQEGIGSYQEKLLAAETNPTETPASNETNACTYGAADYEYRYKGLYVLEYDRHYRLFEYLDELQGNERTTALDIDSDGDEDLLYLMANTLYLKENYKNTDTKEYVSTPPLVVLSGDNPFFNGDIYYEAVNGFEEADVNDSHINISFKKPTNPQIHNFRAEFYTIVDKFRNLENTSYIPSGVKKFVVDSFEDIEQITLENTTENYTLRKNLAYLTDASVIADVILTDQKLINIRDDIASNTAVNIAAEKEIYTGKDPVSFQYYSSNVPELQTFVLEKNHTISFKQAIQIVSVSGNLYIASEIHEDISGTALVQHIGKPLLPGARIRYTGNSTTLPASAHLDIRYYDDSEVALHFNDVYEYRLYDLGVSDSDHLIRLNVENDFYYAKMYSFKDNIASTYTHQILLSPQKEADQSPPEIGLRNKIRVPVYQKKLVDLTDEIYEDSGIANISRVAVDFDLEKDSDNDGDTKNDADTDQISILKNPTSIKIEFGPYTKLFTKKIRVMLTDGNGNEGYKDVDFEVYTPEPQIQRYSTGTLFGEIDETLLNEPVRLYRVRGGTIKKLQDNEGGDVVQTDSGGSYEFGVAETGSGLLVKKDGLDVAYVNEYTGKIELKNPAASIQVLSANNDDNETGFPRISINLAGKEVFYQYLQTSPVADIDITQNSFDVPQGEGISVNLLDQERFGLFKIPLGVSFNPGAVVVYDINDTDKKELFSLFRDGRIYTSSERWQLRYRSFGTHAGYEIVDTTNNTVVTQVVVRLEASYILK